MQCVQRPNLGRRQFLTAEMMLDYPGIALDKSALADQDIKETLEGADPYSCAFFNDGWIY